MNAKVKTIDPILIQRAIEEALEGKIQVLRAVDGFSGSVTLELYFWDDLAEKHPDIFRSATPEDIVSAISVIEKESLGHFKLLRIKPSESTRKVLSVAIINQIGRIIDVSNLYWEIQYSEKTENQDSVVNSQIFWLTPREIYSLISGQKRSFAFKPKGVAYRFLEWFSENKGFVETRVLAEKLGTTSRTLSAEVADLRKKAEEAFGVDSFIESSQGEGYRLNKKIKIKKERDAS
jgi:biotin operon repressor